MKTKKEIKERIEKIKEELTESWLDYSPILKYGLEGELRALKWVLCEE